MLTATYTLVALSVEQTKVRLGLQSLQTLMEKSFLDQQALTPEQVSFACESIHRLCASSHWRKLDMFLIPAIRQGGHPVDELLHSLEELGRAASAAVGEIAIRLSASAIDTPAKVAQFCGAIDAYTTATLQRLALEDRFLFPLARAVISGETWFSIANQMLAHDAYLQDSRAGRPGPASRDDVPDLLPRQAPAASLVHSG
jgi:hypothetical protein